jgi:hypothetical protein
MIVAAAENRKIDTQLGTTSGKRQIIQRGRTTGNRQQLAEAAPIIVAAGRIINSNAQRQTENGKRQTGNQK